MYLIVSAATDGSSYVECLRQHKYKSFLPLIMPCRGSWAENTKIKPQAVMAAFEHHDTVLWIDSDCTIDPPNDLPGGEWDLCLMDNVHPRHKIRVSAGFILSRDTPGTRVFLRYWDSENARHRKDHPAMVQALKKCRPLIKVGDMTQWLRGRHTINALAPGRGEYAG